MAQLLITNTEKFDNEVWQTKTDFTESMYQEWLHDATENLQVILDNSEVFDATQYVLGDVINLLSHLQVKVAPPRTHSWSLVLSWRDSDGNEDYEVIATSATPEKIYALMREKKAELIRRFHEQYDEVYDPDDIKVNDSNTHFAIYADESWDVYDMLDVHMSEEI